MGSQLWLHPSHDQGFFSVDTSTENNIYVADEFALEIVGHGDVTCLHVQIIDVFHDPNLSMNLFSFLQLT